MSTIYSINVDGRNSTLLNILDNIASSDTKPHIILIQDPPKISRELKIRTFLCDYNIICKDTEEDGAENEKYNNIMLYYKHTVETIGNPYSNEITTGSDILINNKLFVVFSIYIKPLSTEIETENALSLIQCKSANVGKSRLILGGDVNAINQLWTPLEEIEGCFTEDSRMLQQNNSHLYKKRARGRRIAKFIKTMKLTCLNDMRLGPTFVSNIRTNQRVVSINDPFYRYASSHIDLIAVGEKALRTWKKFRLISLTGSQHRLLIIESLSNNNNNLNATLKHVYNLELLKPEHILALEISAQDEMRWNFWEVNNQVLKLKIEEFTEKIVAHTLEIQESIRKTIKCNNKKRTGANNTAIQQIHRRKLVKRLKKLEDKYERIRKSSNADRGSVDRLKEKIEQQKNKIVYTFARYVFECSPKINDQQGNRDLWNIVHLIEDVDSGINQLGNRSITANTINSQEEIENIADSKFNRRNVSENFEEVEPMEETYISQFETDNAIYDMRKKKFTGPEGMKFTIYSKLLEFETYRNIIHKWTQMCYKAAYVPNRCRLTTGKLIPKKTPGQFRIVHICSPLSATLEQIALARLEYRLEENLLYNPRQFGFVPLRNRHDLVTRILELAIKHQFKQQFNGRTTIISLDVKGAFDNVDQTLLKEKILTDLAPDSFRVWLANFIQNRKIKIQYGNLIAEERSITKGVPQGSSLGPILWNFTINKIDHGLTDDPERFEVLAYADDIVVIYNGKDYDFLQYKINKLINNLTELRLEVEPNKCQLMIVDFATNQDQIRLELRIDGEVIERVDKMSILGVPINNKLKLNTEDNKFKTSLSKKIQLLNVIKQFDIIINNQDWKTLLESFILSILITNNLPVLAIDGKGIDWINKLINKTLRVIFDWPQNSSIKTIRKLTDTFDARLIVKSAINKFSSKQEHKDGYDLIMRIVNMGGLKNVRASRLFDAIPSNIRPLSTANKTGHTFRDPEYNWRLMQQDDIFRLFRRGPVWVAACSRSTASLFLIINDIIIKEIKGKHLTYPIGYFNLIGLIYAMAKKDNLPTKTIVFNERNSLFAALKNWSNHDWRINELRAVLLDNNWWVTTIMEEQYNNITRMLTDRGRILRISRDINEYPQPLNGQEIDRLNFEWPPVEDYIEIHAIKAKLREEKEQERIDNSTRIVRKISFDTACWLTLPPSWIDGKTILMLTGLVTNRIGSLENGSVEQGRIPVGCGQECTYRSIDTQNNRWNTETTLHRAFNCKHFRRYRFLFRKTINRALMENLEAEYSSWEPWNKNMALKTTLENRRLSQTFLRLLTRVAFIKPTHLIQ